MTSKCVRKLATLVVAAGLAASCGGRVLVHDGGDGGTGGTTICGAAGDACCNGTACNAGLACSGFACTAVGDAQSGADAAGRDVTVRCGGAGEPCCNGTACNNGLMCGGLTCTNVGGDGSIRDAAFNDGVADAADASTPLTACLLWLKMNADQNGNPIDSSPYARNVVAVNGTSRVAGGGPGGPFSADAWSFDGAQGHLDVPYFDRTAASEVSVTAWFLLHAQPSPPRQESLAYHGGGGEFALVYDWEGNDHTVSFDAKTTDGNWYAAMAPFPAAHDTTWAHLAGTWRRNQGVRLYVDGKRAASIGAPDTSLFPLPASWPSRIGMYGGALIEAFDGTLADVRIYARALSDAEVQAVYAGDALGCACPAGYEAHPTGCYRHVGVDRTWLAAEADCESDGGHLVVIDDDAEEAYVASLGTLWIGLTDCLAVPNFRWVTDHPVTTTYWGAGQPDNFGGWERGVQMRQLDGRWNDVHLNAGLPYLCEADGVPSLGPYPAGTYCDTTQNSNCGACGHVCPARTTCNAGTLLCE